MTGERGKYEHNQYDQLKKPLSYGQLFASCFPKPNLFSRAVLQVNRKLYTFPEKDRTSQTYSSVKENLLLRG